MYRYDEEYYQDILNNLTDTLCEVADNLHASRDIDTVEDFIDQVGHLIMEFGGEWDGDNSRG